MTKTINEPETAERTKQTSNTIQVGDGTIAASADRPQLSDAARRALAEAGERRRLADQAAQDRTREIGGREGPDPVRFGDWENGGIASDF